MNFISITQRLRTATAPIHQQLHRLVSLEQIFSTPWTYRDLLCKYWRVIAPIETKLLEFALANHEQGLADLLSRIDWDARLQKARWLEADIKTLSHCKPGRKLECFPTVEGVAALPIHSISQFVGCWYVLEGMTLGNKYLSETLKLQLGIGPTNGGRFFHGYGAITKDHWKRWGHWADAAPLLLESANVSSVEATAESAVESAIGMFQCMADTLQASIQLNFRDDEPKCELPPLGESDHLNIHLQPTPPTQPNAWKGS